jgi:hypothetical protein
MARKNNRSQSVYEKPASELVMQLAAMGKFPEEKAAVEALAKSLERTASDTGLMMQAIIDQCLEGSPWCPTPFEIRSVAAAMKQRIRDRREGSKHAEWERIYGPADLDWSSKMVAAAVERSGHKNATLAIHEQAIRDMLFYTEGDGRALGDREFWEGPRRDGLQSAREFNLTHYPEMVRRIRGEGGWHTERELQSDIPEREW